jgi:hypothetical protein
MACRSFDVRHLSEENYEPPSSYTLVEKDFRTRFAEQKRIAEEYWQMQMSKSLGESSSGAEAFTTGDINDAAKTGGAFSGLEPALPTSTTLGTGTGTGTETAETVSPSRFGDSQSQGIPTVASSMGTSLLVGNSHSHSPGMDTDSFSLVEGPTATAMSYQTPLALSLPQGPSQISLMVQESRRQRLSSSEIEDGLEDESEEEGEANEIGNGNEEIR